MFSRRSIPAIAAAFLFTVFTSHQSAAQVDPNIQVRIETLTPAPDVRPPRVEVEKVVVRRVDTVTVDRAVRIPGVQRKRDLLNAMRATESGLSLNNVMPSAIPESTYEKFGIPKTVVKKKIVKRIVERVETKVKESPPSVTFSATAQSALDTNAAKTNLARRTDWVSGGNALLVANIPISPLDSIVLQAGAATQRYALLRARDVDIAIGDAVYTRVLSSVAGVAGVVSPGTTLLDTFSASLVTRTIFGSGFDPYQLSLVTPGVIWTRRNIDLGSGLCGKPGSEAFCMSSDVSLAGDYTFSDIASQENASAKISAMAFWRPGIDGVVLSASGFVQAKHFTSYLGGRDDLVLQAAGRATWTLAPNASLSAVVQVTQQFSTQKAVEWNGLTVFPLLALNIKL